MNKQNIVFKIRASAIGQIMAGTVGLTDAQKATLSDLESRESGTHYKGLKLTDNMLKELISLRHKRDNPELPEGCKSYVKKWIKETKYKRWDQIKSKYIDKGNYSESDGITAICVQLGLGMVKECIDRKSNDFMTGLCDFEVDNIDTIVDNKSSWSLQQFPMFEKEIPNKDYEMQIKAYMELYNRKHGIVCYTLNDCPEDILLRQFPYNGTPNERQQVAINLIYTQEKWDAIKSKYFSDADNIDFVEIPESERVKPFYFSRDNDFIDKVEKRVGLCQQYVDELVDN